MSRYVDLDDFDFASVDRAVVEAFADMSDSDLCKVLEAYKFVARDQLVNIFNQKYASEVGAKATTIPVDFEKSAEFARLEDAQSVLIQRLVDSDTVCFYVPMFTKINVSTLELELNQYNSMLFYVTPVDFIVHSDPQRRLCTDVDLMFKRILIEALRLHATDVHFDVKHVSMQPKYTVSYRQDSNLYEMRLFEMSADDNSRIISRLIENNTKAVSLDLLSKEGVTGSAAGLLGAEDVELRVSANKALDGYHCVIRIQKKETFNFSIDHLGFAPNVISDLRRLMQKRSGITLITGAVRTGKNTTAFAMLNEMVKEPIGIVSYESPIEVLMPFTQINYFNDEETLLHAVRLAKKQDIDIAFLNEIPNKEVAFAVMDLVNSSISVITTMHVDRLWHLPYKLREYYGDEYKNIISQINGVINQKMFGLSCQECQREMLVESLPDVRKQEFLRDRGFTKIKVSVGCPVCSYKGRISGKNQPYAEHLVFDDELKSALLACDQPYQMEEILKKAVLNKKQRLEDYVGDAVGMGKLATDTLNYIL